VRPVGSGELCVPGAEVSAVVGDDDAALRCREGKLLTVVLSQHAGLARGKDVESARCKRLD
jgi:hypothetical protein